MQSVRKTKVTEGKVGGTYDLKSSQSFPWQHHQLEEQNIEYVFHLFFKCQGCQKAPISSVMCAEVFLFGKAYVAVVSKGGEDAALHHKKGRIRINFVKGRSGQSSCRDRYHAHSFVLIIHRTFESRWCHHVVNSDGGAWG